MRWLAVWWVVCCALGLTLATSLPAAPPSAYARGYHYDYAPETKDAWGFPQGTDTSWVAFRLQRLEFDSEFRGVPWGDARQWLYAAHEYGIGFYSNAWVGTVAWWERGHVAYVEDVEPGERILISEMHQGKLRERWISPGPDYPYAFIYMNRNQEN